MDNQVMTFDLTSSSNLRCLTLILHQFLPSKRLEENNKNLQDSISQNRLFKDAMLEQTNTPKKVFASGSTSEGLSVPKATCKDDSQSWLDIVSNQKSPKLENQTTSKEESTYQVVLEPVNEFPGYAQLAIPDPTYFLPEDVVEVNGRYFVNSEQQKVQYINGLLRTDAENDKFIPRVITGPAINCTTKAGVESPMKYLDKEFDLVLCYPLKQWPNCAEEWLSRKRFSEWPSRRLIEEIGCGGCHIVCIGHPRSNHPEAQFRMSFSLPEKNLARSLNPTQRQSYVLLKILQVQCFKEPKVLSTYCLKNLLFWSCEQTKTSFWKPENLAACLLYLLDMLLFLLSKHKMPHYFLCKNNLIRHVPIDHVREAHRKVSMARKDPLKFIFSFNETMKFSWGPHYTHIRSCMPILKCIHDAGVRESMVLAGEIKSLHVLAVAYLEETLEVEIVSSPEKQYNDIFTERYSIVMEIAKQSAYLKNKVSGSEIPLEQLLLDFLEGINSMAVKAHFLCYLIDIYANSEYLPDIYSQLAGVYHRVAYKSKDQDEIKEMLYDASMAYAKALEHPRCPSFILVEYGGFLNQRKKYANARPVLMKAIERLSKNEGRQLYHVYNKNHEETVDEAIDYVIKRTQQFVVTSAVLAHFLLVRCHLILGEDNNASHLMYRFRKLCAATAEAAEVPPQAKANAFFLISYCCYQLKRWEVCLKNVDRALLHMPGHVGVIWMRTWCLRRKQSVDDANLLPRESLEVNPLPQKTVMPSPLPQESVETNPLSQEFVVPNSLPQETVVPNSLPQESVVTNPLLHESVVANPLPQESVVANPLPQEPVEANPLPQESVVASPLPRESVEAKPLPQQTVVKAYPLPQFPPESGETV